MCTNQRNNVHVERSEALNAEHEAQAKKEPRFDEHPLICLTSLLLLYNRILCQRHSSRCKVWAHRDVSRWLNYAWCISCWLSSIAIVTITTMDLQTFKSYYLLVARQLQKLTSSKTWTDFSRDPVQHLDSLPLSMGFNMHGQRFNVLVVH